MSAQIHSEIKAGLSQGGAARIACTRRAFKLIPKMDKPRILDAGCGEGEPLLELARLSDGVFTGVDIHQPSLDKLAQKIVTKGLSDRVQLINCSMLDMDFPDESFDIIWSEGAIRFIGFERGLQQWRRIIKPQGYICVHEGIFPEAEVPRELRSFWRGRFQGIMTLWETKSAISRSGFDMIDCFSLPIEVWWDDYFCPLKERIQALRDKYAQDTQALNTLDQEEREFEMFVKYPEWYRSAFFVMRKDG